MKRTIPYGAALVLMLAACGQSHAPAKAAGAGNALVMAEPEDVLTMNDIYLYLHGTAPTEDGARPPTFRLHAETFKMLDEKSFLVGNANAVIYAQSPESEEIVIRAERGSFVEGQSAKLEGAVTARVGDMTFELEDFEWQNPFGDAPGSAFSHKPLRLTGPEIELEASSMRIIPDERRLVLTDVSGRLRLGSTL